MTDSEKNVVEPTVNYWWAKLKRDFSRVEIVKIFTTEPETCYPTDCQDYWTATNDWILLERIPEHKEKSLEVKAGFWWAREKHGVSKLQVIEISDNLKNCWMVGCAEWFDLSEWEILKPVPGYSDD